LIRRSRKPHAARKLHGSIFYRTGLLPIRVCIVGIGNFAIFCSRDLDLDPINFIYELDPYPLKISFYINAFESRITYMQTDTQTDSSLQTPKILPVRCFVDGKN